jgi:hypothetical protein
MSSTQSALDALAAILAVIAGDDAGKPLPTLLRNEDLNARMATLPGGLSRFANLWDGKQIQRDEMLGADVLASGYEIQHEAKLELAFVSTNSGELQTAFDAALGAVFQALRDDPTLGGAVDYAALGQLEGPGSGLVTDRIPHSKGIVVPIVLTFVSTLPF